MEIKSLTLKNIGHFKDLEISFAPLEEGKPKVTVFIGNNGSGKTNILKSVVTALSWLPARIRTERGRGLDIPENVICNDEISASVHIDLSVDNTKYQWELRKTRKGRKNQLTSDLKQVAALADQYRARLTDNLENADLPLIVFYPVERSVLDVSLKASELNNFEILNAYNDALKMGINFQSFFEWFRNEEDIENEMKRPLQKELLNLLKAREYKNSEFNSVEYDFITSSVNSSDVSKLHFDQRDMLNNNERYDFRCDYLVWINKERDEIEKRLTDITKKLGNIRNAKLDGVRFVASKFLDFYNIHVHRKKMIMTVEKKLSAGQNKFEQLNVLQLSQGEKSLMALVGDIARRLAMLNPSLNNPLHGKGVVIIDEADLHLHPQWQRQLIARLTQTFPNCQFILSTHSPLVISDSKDIVVYALENGEMTKIPSQYGQDANTVYLNAMDTAIRNQRVTEQLNDLLDLIQDNELEQAKRKLSELKKQLPENHLELTKAQFLLKKQEIRHAKNQ